MSTYVTRVIQVKKNNEWQTLKWYGKTKAYSKETDGIFYCFDEFTDNAILFREILAESNLKERGLPSDIVLEEEVLKQIKNYNDIDIKSSDIVPGFNRYCYNTTWFTLAELAELFSKEIDKFFNEFEYEILNKDYINKIDAIYSTLILNKPTTAEEPVENYSEYMKEESLYSVLRIRDEIKIVQHLVDELYGYVPYESIRIIIYYS